VECAICEGKFTFEHTGCCIRGNSTGTLFAPRARAEAMRAASRRPVTQLRIASGGTWAARCTAFEHAPVVRREGIHRGHGATRSSPSHADALAGLTRDPCGPHEHGRAVFARGKIYTSTGRCAPPSCRKSLFANAMPRGMAVAASLLPEADREGKRSMAPDRSAIDEAHGTVRGSVAKRLSALLVGLALVLPPDAAAMGEISGGALPLPGDEITDTQRAAINARLAASVETLRQAGRIPALADKLGPGAASQTAPAVLLQWPVQLVPGHPEAGARTVINYVDHDPAYPGALQDYNCGTRTYDQANGYNHRGTDITAFPFAWRKMDNDEAIVIAAASGVIISKEDGQYDRSCVLNGNPWNAVYVMHPDGSIAWYGHLKSGSLTSKLAGQWVLAGEFLGVMGSSGDSTGPHLHFELYDASGTLVDPFAGACNPSASQSWWGNQRLYDEQAIDLVMTGDAPVDFSTCPIAEVEHRNAYFQAGQTVYLSAFFTDQHRTDNAQFSVFAPDGTQFGHPAPGRSTGHVALSGRLPRQDAEHDIPGRRDRAIAHPDRRILRRLARSLLRDRLRQ